MFKTGQTKILGVTSLLAVLAGAAYYALQGEFHKSGSFALFASIPLLINLYTVHCVVFGRCTFYSWILTVVLTLYAGGVFFTYGKLLLKKREIAKVASESKKAAGAAEKMLGIGEMM
jgi:hypothetical protein